MRWRLIWQYMRRGLLRSGMIALALLPTGLLIGPLIDIFYGTAYHPAARLYQLLLVVVISDLFTTPIVLLAYHHQRPQLLAGADLLRVGAMLAVGTILIPAAGPLGGVTGAVVARLAAKVAGVLLVLMRLPRGGKGVGS
jgi:O-antigen/teichoic acid export membrane protein